MSNLMGILYTGVSGLFAAQAGIDVTGNNLSKMKTEGYSKQVVNFASATPQSMGHLVFGRGVKITNIQRNYDELLYKSYLGEKTSHSYFSSMQSSIKESMLYFNELEAGSGLGDAIKEYFNSWQELSSTAPGGPSADATVKRNELISKTQILTTKIREGYQSIVNVKARSDSIIASNVNDLNTMIKNVADLNQQISSSEAGGGSANDLRDARDLIISKMSDKANISIYERGNGQVTLSMGGQTLVDGSTFFELSAARNSANNNHMSIYLKIPNANSDPLNIDSSINSGIIGAEMKSRDVVMPKYLTELDRLAKMLIEETNSAHATGQGTKRMNQMTGSNSVINPLYTLSSETGELPYPVNKGSFTIQVYDENIKDIIDPSSGDEKNILKTITIDVDPDIDTFENIVNKINHQSDGKLTARLDADGKLNITSSGNTTFAFTEDTSNLLVAAGMNRFFTGKGASDIDISDIIASNSDFIATGKSGKPGDNSNALIISSIQTKSIGETNTTTVGEFYGFFIGMMSSDKAQVDTFAATKKMSYNQVYMRLESVRGVVEGEELVNMTLFQRSFEANSRFINTVDGMLNTIINGLGAVGR